MLSGPEVASLLGFPEARERRKYACVACDSSDALHVYDDGAHCYSCEWSGSVIDLAAVWWGVEPAEACRRLADHFRVGPDPTYRPIRSPARTTRSDRGPSSDTVRRRAEVYGWMVETLELGSGGRTYLSGRGLDPDLAAAHGIRSLEDADAWSTLYQRLEAEATSEALIAAGLRRDGRPWLPWRGRVPALLLPYRSRTGQTGAVRWRRTTAGKCRYMAPVGAGARIPWGAETVDGPRPLHLVVAEGELDALALLGQGYNALALGGATPARAVLAWIVEAVTDVNQMALWTDADEAGERAVDRLSRMLAQRYGSGWVRDRVTRWRSSRDPAETLSGRVP